MNFARFILGGYASEPELARGKKFDASKYLDEGVAPSPPNSPPPFSKAESRYEREKRIKVGNVDDYRCGQTSSTYDPERDRFEPPPNVSSAQKNYEKDRFKVQPGPIKSYSLGRGSIATHERQKVRK